MSRFFFPRGKAPDLLGLLDAQAETSERAVAAFARWSHGETREERTVRDLEHEADDRKRALRAALRAAYFTPIDAEDLYELSERLDNVVNSAKDAIREADVMDVAPDPAMGAMADQILAGVECLTRALHCIAEAEAATKDADAAVSACRRVERVYRKAARDLLEVESVVELTARRELYRRYARLSDSVIAVAERVWYAVVKEP